MDNQSNNRSNEELQSRLIEQYKNLKKENQDLMDKLNKVKVSTAAEVNIEKEQQKKAMLELTKLNRENKDLKMKNRQLESSLQIKDNEIQDLKTRLEMKGSMESKHTEKDLITFQKYVGRSPMDTSAQDSKIISIIRVFEGQKERLEEENRKLSRELNGIKDKFSQYDQEINGIRKEVTGDREVKSKDYILKLEHLESENDSIVKENVSLRANLEKMQVETSRLRDEGYEIKRKYDNLRSRLDDDAQRPLESKELVDARQSSQVNTMSSQQFGATAKEGQENFYSFKPFAELTDLTLFECRKLISEIQDMFNIRSPAQIVPSIRKMERVIQAIPRLQGLIQEVCEYVLPRINGSANFDQIDMIVPAIKDLCIKADAAEEFKELRTSLIGLLNLKDGANNNEITFKVENLIKAAKPGAADENALLIEQFSKMLGAKPNVTMFKQILMQFDDIKHFIGFIKKKLNLDPNMSNEACLTYMLKHLENSKKEDQAVEIVNKLRKMLVCNTEDIIRRVEEVATNKNRKVYVQ